MSDVRDIFENFVEGYARDNFFTSMIAIVLSVNNYGTRQTVDVRPAIARLKTTGQVISNDELVIYEVPVVCPAGGGGLLSFPIKAGDNVWLDFSMRSIEDWQNSDGKGEIAPSDSRHFHQTDAVAFPCIYTSSNNLKPSTENVELKFGECMLSMKPSGELVVNNGGAKITLKANGDIDIDPTTLLRVLGNMEILGTLHVTSDVTVDTTVTATTDVVGGGTSLHTHTHIGSPTSPAGPVTPTGVPT